ncbi:MAG: CBS domain-containing protein [Anaerolineales bacterium]
MARDKNYTILIVILHNLDVLPELLEAWKQAGIPGVTLLPSAGGFQAHNQFQRSGLSGLLSIFEQTTPHQRMLMSLIDSPDTLATAISEAERVVGGFDRPNSGILFTMPVGQALGLKKWGDTRRLEKEAGKQNSEKAKLDKGTANLLGWFEEEVRAQHGDDTLTGWRKKSKQLISMVLKSSLNPPTIVSVDTPVRDVIKAFLANPNVPTVCVINREDRMVGVIQEFWFAEMMLVPAMPEKFIQNPDQYEKAIAYARMDPDQKAFDIMEDPVFILNESTMEEAFFAIHEAKATGLPVVNKHYRVQGYLTLSELMAAYFGE